MSKTRQDMIDRLVTHWAEVSCTEGPAGIEDTLRHGCTGFYNLSDERLLEEYEDVFEDTE